MIGRWFHSHHLNGDIEWQGQILARPEPGIYLVQLCSWFTGEANGQKLVPLADMKGWTFYDTAEEMNEACDRQATRTRKERM